MAVFAWILFIVSVLATFAYTLAWFSEQHGLVGLLQSLGLVVYLVFYLFINPFGIIANWIFFAVYCLLFLGNLFFRKPFGTLQSATAIIFMLLVIF